MDDENAGGRTDSSPNGTEQILSDLPPSCVLVYKALEQSETPLTRQQIDAETYRTRKTTQYALDRLQEHGLVEKTPHQDKPKYLLAEDWPFAPA